MAWQQVKEAYTPRQFAMLKRLGKVGEHGFHVVRSTEQASAGASKDKPTRFKPAPPR